MEPDSVPSTTTTEAPLSATSEQPIIAVAPETDLLRAQLADQALVLEALKQNLSGLEDERVRMRDNWHRARGLLAELQWCGPNVQTPAHRQEASCPKCKGLEPMGHNKGCALAEEIR